MRLIWDYLSKEEIADPIVLVDLLDNKNIAESEGGET